MPNRILRDWTDSETIDLLTPNAERFFTRLIMKADDFGRFSANPKILLPNLFPLKIGAINEANIIGWLDECRGAGLVIVYSGGTKKYIQIENFNQRLRQKVEKYPSPASCGHVTVIRQTDDGLKGREVETEEEVEVQESTGSFYEKILSDNKAIENNQMLLRLKDFHLPMMAKDFHLGVGQKHTEYDEYKKHFLAWAGKVVHLYRDKTKSGKTPAQEAFG